MNDLVFEPVYGSKRNLNRFGCINIDIDTIASDLDSELCSIKDMRLADISWSLSVPRALELFKRCDIKATFFIIGKHLELQSCRECVKEIVASGHEIANHTMNHSKQFANLSKREIEKEIRECHGRLIDVAGKPPLGFRAPGYTMNSNVINVLLSLGYRYDASLNVSKTYKFAKTIFKNFIAKEADYVTIQNCKILPAQERAFRVLSKQSVGDNYPFLLFPINIIPFIHYPFISSTLITFGYNITKFFYGMIRNKIDVLNYELHDIEFLSPRDIAGTGFNVPYFSSRYTRISLEKREKYFENTFKLFKTDFQLLPFGDIIGNLS